MPEQHRSQDTVNVELKEIHASVSENAIERKPLHLLMSLLRVCARAAGLPAASRSNTTAPLLISRRLYASKSKGSSKASKEKEFEKTGNKRAPVSTNSFIPGSKLRITDAAQEEYGKCESKMKSAVEWYRKEVGGLETRAAGRVTPALLSPVRVVLPDRGSDSIRLEEIATVGVKDGSTLIVTVFEESVRVPLCKLHVQTIDLLLS